MSKIITVKCDRCGKVLNEDESEKKGTLRLVTPTAAFVADLCPPCCSQIKSDVTFLARKLTGKPKAKAA